jgi:two-component system cell cycle response regulator DivK
MTGDKEKAIDAGAIGYIEKPIDPDTFISQMEAFLPPHLVQRSKN